MNTNNPYYGDDRDLLESIYPTCTSFVRNTIPAAARASVEVALNPNKEEEKKLFNLLCYSYEDSYDWNALPLVFCRSGRSEITWRKNGSIVRRASLEEGVRHFDEITNEINQLNKSGDEQ